MDQGQQCHHGPADPGNRPVKMKPAQQAMGGPAVKPQAQDQQNIVGQDAAAGDPNDRCGNDTEGHGFRKGKSALLGMKYGRIPVVAIPGGGAVRVPPHGPHVEQGNRGGGFHPHGQTAGRRHRQRPGGGKGQKEKNGRRHQGACQPFQDPHGRPVRPPVRFVICFPIGFQRCNLQGNFPCHTFPGRNRAIYGLP